MKKPSVLQTYCLTLLFAIATQIVSPAQVLTTLVTFNGTNGAAPNAVVQGTDGNFYGTASQGGSSGNCPGGCGTVFKVTPDGMFTVLHNFSGSDGGYPQGALVQGIDGNFYGTTYSGGAGCGNCGTIFKITPGGTFNLLHTFHDGYNPYAGLLLATDGNFYGTTYDGGAHGGGTVFQLSPRGTLTTVYSFCLLQDCFDGFGPDGSLVEGTDGNFYGTTEAGGNGCDGDGCGTVFQLSASGAFFSVYRFCYQNNCSDGSGPYAGVIQASDGNFYGTTINGGLMQTVCPQGCGTIYTVTTGGILTTLYDFCSQTNCDDGISPLTLLQATDGNFYGTTAYGGQNGDCTGCGTVFKITPSGLQTVFYAFRSEDGSIPIGLVQAGDGNFYGATLEGGGNGCGGTGCGTVFRLTGPTPTPFQFLPVTPCRLVDTRNPNGEFGGPPIQGGTYRSFVIPENADCNIPPSAAAYSLNVTVVPHGPLGYLTVWPTGRNQPGVSTMNSLDARTKANAAIVPAGANKAINVFASNTTDLVLDIDGYFVGLGTLPGLGGVSFYPLTPCRVIDTRNPNGDLGGPYLTGGVTRNFPVEDSSCVAGIPNIQAYSLNVTVVPHPDRNPLGYLTVWPQGLPQPNVSTLNNPTGTDVANAAIVPVGDGYGISVFPSNNTDLVVDINGYFAPLGPGGLSLYPTAPCRVLDTRDNHGQPFVGEKTVNVVGSPCAPPSGARAYVFNATVVPSGALGYLTLWPDGLQQPGVSTLNALDAMITSNMAIVPTTNGSIDAFASNLTQLVLDISSYFAP